MPWFSNAILYEPTVLTEKLKKTLIFQVMLQSLEYCYLQTFY